MKYYNNPENLSGHEVFMKIMSFKTNGPNRIKRFWLLSSYKTNEITQEEYIRFYTHK